MKRLGLMMILFTISAIGTMAQTATPPASTPGNVMRITYFDIKPGRGAEFMKFRREHVLPIAEEGKRQGLIIDYMWLTSPVGDGPTNWDLAFVLVHKNYADALENAEFGEKWNAIFLKHYGSQEAREKADAYQRELRDVMSSHLVRHQIVNPMPPK
ncbi:MAG: hypothetical protein ACKVQJ_10045 [Pyrinomonadaceae bacterium]